VADTLRVLSLCSGIGGLERGIHLATGGRSRVVCYVERELFAAAVLAEAGQDGRLDAAPVFVGDLAEFDGRAWRGRVDLVAAGYPC